MRITEGQLRRIIRQEVRALNENFSPAAIAALGEYGVNEEDWDLWSEEDGVLYGSYGEEIDLSDYDSEEMGYQAPDPDEPHRSYDTLQQNYRGRNVGDIRDL